ADESIDHETPLSEVFGDQIACADIILLTKPDLAGAEGVAQAKAIIERDAPRRLPVIEVAEGVVDPRVILGLEAAAEDDIDARPSHHEAHHHHHDEDDHHRDEHDHDHHHHHEHDHGHDNFNSITVDIPELSEPEDLVQAIESLANSHNILRVKGYAAVAGKPMRLLVQAVGSRVRHQFDRPWAPGEARQGRLVVIAEHDDINREIIEAALGIVQQAAE
ncbi:MAG: GTP-binding protein, partial [Arenibacterium sp.]